MTLYMLQLTPDLGRLTRWAGAQGLLPARGEADLGYALHAALAAAFGPMAPKPFALQTRRVVSILGYTPHTGAALRDQAACFAPPEVHALLDLDRLADKRMPAGFAPGQALGFELRARPTLRTDRDGDRNRVAEKDAFLLAPAGADRGEVYTGWLARHMEAGARVRRVTLEAFRQTRVLRRRADRGFSDRAGPDAVFSGVLEVTDPGAFAALLARGVGRHRAFGFGMLLLRPP